MTQTIRNVACTVCGCVCDDLAVHGDGEVVALAPAVGAGHVPGGLGHGASLTCG